MDDGPRYCECDKVATHVPETLRCAKWQVALDARRSARDTRRMISMHTRSRAVRYFSRAAKRCADCGRRVRAILICYATAVRPGSVRRAFPGGTVSPVLADGRAAARARPPARGASPGRASAGGGSSPAGSGAEFEAESLGSEDSDASPSDTGDSSSDSDEGSSEAGEPPAGAPGGVVATAAAEEAIAAKLKVAAAVIEQARLLAGSGPLASRLVFIGGAVERVLEHAESMGVVLAELRSAQSSVERARAASGGAFLVPELAAARTIVQLAIDAAGARA